jgi:excisionase family DNA binding protein
MIYIDLTLQAWKPVDGPRGRLVAWDGMSVVLDGEEFLTVDEAARLLGVKPATLYAYVSRGVLRSYRQGIKRQRLYRRSEIESLLRLAVSGAAADASEQRTPRRGPEDIPLAESWIRD